jgi:hypothetical protein
MSAGPEVTSTPQVASGTARATSSPVQDAQPETAPRTAGNGAGNGNGNGAGNGRAAGNRSGRSGAKSGASRSSGGRHRSGGTGPQPAMAEDAAEAPGLPAGLAPRRSSALQYTAPSVDGGTHVESHVEGNPVAATGDFTNVGRNDPCPCGSGRKYKRCHGDPRNRETV